MSAIFDSISEPVAQRVTAGLAKIGLVLRSRAWKGAGSAGITPTQGQALNIVQEAPEGLRLGALATLLGVSAPTASDAVNALVGKGLLAKEAGTDRRSVKLVLTAAGEAVAGRTREWPGFLADAVDTLPVAEQAGLLRALVGIVRALQRADHIPQQRMCVTCRFFQPYATDDPAAPHRCDFVGAPFGDRHLRLHCAEQQPADADRQEEAWARFSDGPRPAAAP